MTKPKHPSGVVYKSPPVEHRFKRGAPSPNPFGRAGKPKRESDNVSGSETGKMLMAVASELFSEKSKRDARDMTVKEMVARRQSRNVFVADSWAQRAWLKDQQEF